MTEKALAEGSLGLLSSFSTVFALQALGLAASYGFVSVATNLVSPADFGVYSYIYVLAILFGITGLAGTQNLVLRFATLFRSRGDRSALGALTGFVRRRVAVALPAAAAAAVAFVGVSSVWKGVPVDWRIASATAGLVLLHALVQILGDWIRSMDRTGLSIFFRQLTWRLVAIAGLGAALLAPSVLPVDWRTVFAFVAAGMLVTIALELWFIRIASGPAATRAPDVKVIGGETARHPRWRSASHQFWLDSVGYSLMQHSDLVVLSLFVPLEQVGVYFLATRLAQFLVFFQTVARLAFAPKVAAAHERGEVSELRAITAFACLAATAPALGALGVLVVANDQIAVVFGGDAYREGVVLAVWIGMVQLTSVSLGMGSVVLQMTGHERDATRCMLLGIAILIPALAVLVPWLGVYGAILARLAFVLVSQTGTSLLVYRRLRIDVTLIGSTAWALEMTRQRLVWKN